MRYFIDTEFIENGSHLPVHLISIGIVCEDGRTFYAEDKNAPLLFANKWVQKNVVPHLRGSEFRISYPKIRQGILDLVGEDIPEFWGYYSDYDWVVFCQIFGTMMELPKGWPMFCMDLKQWAVHKGNPTLPPQTSTEHNALNDAWWNMFVWEYLQSLP